MEIALVVLIIVNIFTHLRYKKLLQSLIARMERHHQEELASLGRRLTELTKQLEEVTDKENLFKK